MPQVKAAFGHSSDTSIYSRVRSGELTKPVNIGKRAVGWPSHEVEAIVAATIAGHSVDEIKALVVRLHADRAKLSPLLVPPAQESVQVKTTAPAPAPAPLPKITTRRKSLVAA